MRRFVSLVLTLLMASLMLAGFAVAEEDPTHLIIVCPKQTHIDDLDKVLKRSMRSRFGKSTAPWNRFTSTTAITISRCL